MRPQAGVGAYREPDVVEQRWRYELTAVARDLDTGGAARVVVGLTELDGVEQIGLRVGDGAGVAFANRGIVELLNAVRHVMAQRTTP